MGNGDGRPGECAWRNLALSLSRLAKAGHFERLVHGVYKDAGAPSDEFDDLRAAWLSTDPNRLAEDRIRDAAREVVVASTSAAFLHGMGTPGLTVISLSLLFDVRVNEMGSAFGSVLEDRDVTIVRGLPAMRTERTLVDLLEDIGDQSLVADALGAAMRKQVVDLDRLRTLLGPLAERNGFKKNDGAALLDKLAESAGLDLDSVARRIAANPVLSARVTAEYMQNLLSTDQGASLRRMMAEIKLPTPIMTAELAEAVQIAIQLQLDAIPKMMPSLESPSLTQAVTDAVNTQAFENLSKEWTKNITFPSLFEAQSKLPVPANLEEHHDAIE